MLKNASIKIKITITCILMLTILAVSLIINTIITSKNAMTELSLTCLKMKISGDIEASRNILAKYFGKMRIVENHLVDQHGQLIDKRFEMVDEIKAKLGVAATIFVKDGDDFTRVITNVHDQQGRRAVGTRLGSGSAAFKPIKRKETYIGIAEIMGMSYLTAYDPILDGSNTLIGILFIGVPMTEIHEIICMSLYKSIFTSLTITVIMLILIAIVLIIVTGRIFQPVMQILNMLRDISEGEKNLTRRLEIKNNDETARIAEYFNNFIGKIQELIKSISGNAETVDFSAVELSAVSKLIASNAVNMGNQTKTAVSVTGTAAANVNTITIAAEEMSTSANSVAAAIEEMTASLNEVSRNCQKELQIATEASGHARNSKEIMDRLGTAAKSIGTVIELINRIADKTNLLALNATIEAASAGEAGKGFSVVASEVKELAKQTALATKEIETQIEGMQMNTDSAIKAIELVARVIEEVNSTSQTIVSAVEEQSATINEISRSINSVNTGAKSVARSVTESARGLEDVSSTITGINTVFTDTAQGIIQVNNRAEELTGLSRNLKLLLGQFKV